MRKIELVHLHELLSVVRTEYEQQTRYVVDCETYERLDVRPMSLAESKAEHEEAVLTLADELATAVAEGSPPRATTDRTTESDPPVNPPEA